MKHQVPDTYPRSSRTRHAYAAVAKKLFRAAARTLPQPLRDEYRAEMVQVFDHSVARALRRGGVREGISCTWVALTDVLRTAIVERRPRPAPTHSSPSRRGPDPSVLPGTANPSMLDQISQDVRYAFRTLAQRPGLAIAAMLSLALGIGANVAIYSLVDALLLRPVPLESPEELLSPGSRVLTYPAYRDFRDRSRTLSDIAAWDSMGRRMVLRRGEAITEVSGVLVSGNYFDVLGVDAAVGRTIAPADDVEAGASPVVVISHGLWDRQFAADEGVIGGQIRVNGYPLTVIGVAQPGFRGERLDDVKELWIPLAMHPLLTEGGAGQLEDRDSWWIRMMGRVAPGETPAQVLAELNSIGEQLAREHPATDSEWQFSELLPASEVATVSRREDLSRFVFLLSATVGAALLIACVNVSNLLLVRNEQRRRELGMRLALGATRGRIARQMLTESVMLATGGGAVGILVSWWAFDLIRRFQLPGGIDIGALELGVRPGTLISAVLLSALTALLFGTLPAWRASDPSGTRLRRWGRGVEASSAFLRDSLVALQVALSIVLLLGGGLFVRSLVNATVTDLGFEARDVIVADIGLGAQGYDVARADAFYRVVGEGIGALPGVRAVSWSNAVPVESRGYMEDVIVEGFEPSGGEGRSQSIHMNMVTGDFFATVGIPIVRGRTLDARPDAREVVVNSVLADRYWPGENPLGKRLRLGGSGNFEVVGLVAATKTRHLDEEPFPYVYAPLFFDGSVGTRRLAVRTSEAPADVATSIRQLVAQVDAAVPLSNVRTWTDHVGEQTRSQQMGATLLGFFSLVSLILAAVGIYGVVSFSVTRRSRELGIRMALGAQRRDVLRLVLRSGSVPLFVGIAVGVLLGLAAGRLVAGFLFEVQPHDPLTLVTTALATLLVGLAAIAVPARRATRADPSQALRSE